jgi:hypothetical protein
MTEHPYETLQRALRKHPPSAPAVQSLALASIATDLHRLVEVATEEETAAVGGVMLSECARCGHARGAHIAEAAIYPCRITDCDCKGFVS